MTNPEDRLRYLTARFDASEDTNELSWLHRNVLQRLFSKSSPPVISNTETSSAHSNSEQRSTLARLNSSISLNSQDVEQCLLQYANIQLYFPFVPLPQSWSIDNMKEKHPVLLQGILSAMTIHRSDVNTHLCDNFLRDIAEKAVIKGEKSLDIIEGILVQIAWSACLLLFPHSN